MKDLKTPLRYPGGKSRATDFLFDEKNMPIKKIREYREPFLGGGSCGISFSKRFPQIPVWVNDKYYNLYCFWLTLQKEGENLANKLHSVKDELSSSSDPLQAHLDYYKVMREGLKSSFKYYLSTLTIFHKYLFSRTCYCERSTSLSNSVYRCL